MVIQRENGRFTYISDRWNTGYLLPFMIILWQSLSFILGERMPTEKLEEVMLLKQIRLCQSKFFCYKWTTGHKAVAESHWPREYWIVNLLVLLLLWISDLIAPHKLATANSALRSCAIQPTKPKRPFVFQNDQTD